MISYDISGPVPSGGVLQGSLHTDGVKRRWQNVCALRLIETRYSWEHQWEIKEKYVFCDRKL